MGQKLNLAISARHWHSSGINSYLKFWI